MRAFRQTRTPSCPGPPWIPPTSLPPSMLKLQCGHGQRSHCFYDMNFRLYPQNFNSEVLSSPAMLQVSPELIGKRRLQYTVKVPVVTPSTAFAVTRVAHANRIPDVQLVEPAHQRFKWDPPTAQIVQPNGDGPPAYTTGGQRRRFVDSPFDPKSPNTLF